MPRPSRNLDQALLAAGRALLPQRGCSGLSVREVADAAGVNLGMFHYHFKSREAFLRALLQSMYEDMFSQLTFQGSADWTPRENLRAALRFMGRFVRANRPMLARVMADALCGDEIAPIPVPQALGMCAGSIAMPILFGGAVADSGALGAAGTRMISATLLSDAAIDQRIDLALAAISNPSPPAQPTKRRASASRGKK